MESAPRDCCCFDVVCEGTSASSGQTSLTLYHGQQALEAGAIGIPVTVAMLAEHVAVSWLAGSDPGADWTLTLQVRAPGESSFVDVATFDVHTS